MTRRGAQHDSQSSSAATSARLIRRVDAALKNRRSLLASRDTNAVRLFNGQSDGIDGLVIEQYAQVLVAQCHQGILSLSEPELRTVCERAMRATGAVAVYRKIFVRDRSHKTAAGDGHRDRRPWIGGPVPPLIPILENGMRLCIRPYDGFAVGLYLDQRENRHRIRELARGRRLLNAFSYTCAFSVAAALGGAVETVSVDVSKKHLAWGRRNFAANKVPLNQHQFICADIFDYFRRARKQRRRFDVVILDPPSFARTKRPARTFVLSESLPALLAEAAELLNSHGQLLVSTNHREISATRLERLVERAAGHGRFEIIARPPLPADFAGDDDYSKSIIARLELPT